MRKIILLTMLFGCRQWTHADTTEIVTYTKDSRTKLCFASKRPNGLAESFSMTNVPCTPEVERLIK